MDNSKKLANRLFPDKEVKTEILDVPPEKRMLHTEVYDFTVQTLVSNLNEGDIKIPEFQRGYVWNRAQASRLIESLIIQCPIPVIYLSQQQNEELIVIDGNQRLNSLKLFLENAYPLRGLEVYPELEGYYFSELDPRIIRHINKRTIRCIVILKSSHPQIKFDVFQRLNTGSVKLNDQELRHGLHYGNLIKLSEELSKEKIWLELTETKSNKRKKSEELILRFFSLLDNLENYKKPFVAFLNNFVEENRDANDDWIFQHKAIFLNTLKIVHQLFGEYSFKLFDEDLIVSSSFNNAIFDAEMVAVAKLNIGEKKLQNLDRTNFRKNIGKMFDEEEYKELISSGTSTTTSVKKRVQLMIERIENNL